MLALYTLSLLQPLFPNSLFFNFCRAYLNGFIIITFSPASYFLFAVLVPHSSRFALAISLLLFSLHSLLNSCKSRPFLVIFHQPSFHQLTRSLAPSVFVLLYIVVASSSSFVIISARISSPCIPSVLVHHKEAKRLIFFFFCSTRHITQGSLNIILEDRICVISHLFFLFCFFLSSFFLLC